MPGFRFIGCFLFSVLLFSSACRNGGGDSADPTDVILNFKVSYEGDQLVFQSDSVEYKNNQSLIFEVFKMFLSDAKIYSSDGAGSIDLFEVEMLDFSNLTTNSLAESGLDIIVRGVPSGNYSRIDFGIGVNPDFNKTAPSEYGGNHPLANSEMYVNSTFGYLFWTLSGRADLNGDGDYSDQNFNYFNRGDDHFIPRLKFYHDFEFTAGETGNVNFELDLKKMLDGVSGYVDIQNNPSTNVDNIDILSDLFNENLENALVLKP